MALTRQRLVIWPIHSFGPPQAHGMQGLIPNDDPGAGLRTGPIGGSGWADTATPFNEVNDTEKRAVNRGIVFGNKVFFAHQNRIRSYRYPNQGASGTFTPAWKTEFNFGGAGTPTFNGRHTGLYAMRNRGRPILACAFYASASGADFWRVATYTPSDCDNGTWAENTAVNVGVTDSQYDPKAEICWRNNLYFVADSADGVARWNPDANTWKNYPLTSMIGPWDFTPYNNRLYLVGRDASASNNVKIMEVGPANITTKFTLVATGVGGATENQNTRSCIWTDGVFLHLWYMSGTNSFEGFRHIVCTGDPITGEINYIKDDTQLINFSVLSSTQGPNSRAAMFVDGSTDGIDTQKPSYVMAIDTSAATGTFKREYHWSFNEQVQSSTWTDTGGTVGTYFDETTEVQTRDTCGERTWNEHFYYSNYMPPRMMPWWFQIISSGDQPLKIRTSFEVIPNNQMGSLYQFPAGSQAAVSFTYNLSSHMPLKRATLTSPSGGTLIWDNKVMQVVANSGTRYEVTIDLGADGVYDARNLSLGTFVALTGVL